MLVNPRTLVSRFITSGSEHMYRRYWEMPIENTFPIYLHVRTTAQIPILLRFGHLSNLLKTRLGSNHSEKTEFLCQIQRKKPKGQFKPAFTREGNSDLPSKWASPFSSMVDITVDPKGVAKLLDGLNVHKASGLDGLNARVLHCKRV